MFPTGDLLVQYMYSIHVSGSGGIKGSPFVFRKKAFDVDDGKLTYKDFHFCGREVSQDEEGNITVTCKATAEKIEPIQYRTGVKKTESCNDQEKAQLRSVVGSLAWVARQSRPDLSYRVSKLQSVTSKATIKDLVLANKTVEEAKEYSSHGLYFRAKAFDWNSAILVTVSDASWANEKEMVRGEMESFRSQRARMTLLVDSQFLNSDEEHPETCFYPIGWTSTVIRRVCRSTLQAESYAMSSATEDGMRIRATIRSPWIAEYDRLGEEFKRTHEASVDY